MSKCPFIDPHVLLYLEEQFPEVQVSPTDTEGEIKFRCGQRSVVLLLKQAAARQYDEHRA